MIDAHGREAATLARENPRAAARAGHERQPRKRLAVGWNRWVLEQLLIGLHRVGSGRVHLNCSARTERMHKGDRLAGSPGNGSPRSLDETYSPRGMHSGSPGGASPAASTRRLNLSAALAVAQ